jgi:Dienelactone hydrolase and related enzymes
MVILGYCFGGAAVLEAARAGADLDGFVSFHGGLGTPDGQDYSAASAPIQLFHGSADPVSGMADLAALLDQLQAAGVPHGAEIFGGARHSFTVWGSRDYDLEADRGSWEGLLGFLEETL